MITMSNMAAPSAAQNTERSNICKALIIGDCALTMRMIPLEAEGDQDAASIAVVADLVDTFLAEALGEALEDRLQGLLERGAIHVLDDLHAFLTQSCDAVLGILTHLRTHGLRAGRRGFPRTSPAALR